MQFATDTNNDQIMSEDLKYLTRVNTEIPVIKLGYEFIVRLIAGLKESSVVVEWSLDKASKSIDQVVKYPLPYIKGQLLAIDQVLCTSLDLTELNLPVLTKTPQELYNQSVEYVTGVIAPISNWVDVELLPPAEYYIDQYLPELDTDYKINHVDDKKGSRARKLGLTLMRRVGQHAHAEPKYLGSLISDGYNESILLMKMLIFDPKMLPKTFHQIWKKLSDGVTPEEAANSLLLVEMGCIKLRKGAGIVVRTIEISLGMAKCYIEMLVRYLNAKKNYVVENLSRVVNSESRKQNKNVEINKQSKNVEIKKQSKHVNQENDVNTNMITEPSTS